MKKIIVFFPVFFVMLIFLTGCNGKELKTTINLDLPEGISLADEKLDPEKLEINKNVEFLITPEVGKELDKLTINGIDKTSIVVDNKFTVKIEEGLKISIKFKNIQETQKDKFSVTLGEHLTSDDPLLNIEKGMTVNIFIDIPDGKEVDEFKVDNKVIDLDGDETYELVVSKDHIVTVKFKDLTQDPNKYTVIWKNYDGTILEKDTNVPFGVMPSYDGKLPTRPGDYYFKEWSPVPNTVYDNIEYTAVFRSGEEIAQDYAFIDLGEGYAVYKYYGLDNHVVIPALYKNKPIISIEYGAFFSNKKIMTLVVPDSVVEIKEYAFSACSNLTTVKLGNGLKKIGNNAFSSCKNLSSINLPEGLTTIDSYAFSQCGSLESITLPDGLEKFGFSALSNTGDHMFTDYKNGKYIGSATNPYLVFVKMNLATENKIEIHDKCKIIGDQAFLYSSTLDTINFGKGVQIIGENAFSHCTKIGPIVIPKTVIRIENRAFSNSSITSFSFAEESAIKYIGSNVFTECYNLRTVHLSNGIEYIGNDTFPNTDTLTKTKYDNAYYIGSIDNPHFYLLNATDELINTTQFDTVNIHPNTKIIASYAFNQCESLKNVAIPKGVIYIGEGAFYRCDSITNITVDSGNNRYSAPNKTALIDKTTGTLICGFKNTTIPAGVVHIGDYAFGESKITSITIPDGVITIGKGAFYKTSLESIMIPDTVTKIGSQAFSDCYNLVSATLSKNINYIDSMLFKSCFKLEQIKIPDAVSYIGQSAFTQCMALEDLTFGSGLVVIGTSAFEACSGISKIVIPNSVKAIETMAFYCCSEVTSISIGSGVMFIDILAFSKCHLLSTVVVDPDNKVYDSRDNCNGIVKKASKTLILGIKTTDIPQTVTIIGECAFYGLKNVDSIELDDNIKTIEEYAFFESYLKTIKLSNNLSYIGEKAFGWNRALEVIIIPKKVQNISYNAFEHCPKLIIYAEATEKPDYWTYSWNSSDRPVYWYSEESNMDGSHWRYVDGVPVIWTEQ
ncbi:MAG: leucine-rich repeat domain-containing protein [Candidatus Izemoplasmatales bacterium]